MSIKTLVCLIFVVVSVLCMGCPSKDTVQTEVRHNDSDPIMQTHDEGKNLSNDNQSTKDLTSETNLVWKSPYDSPENPEDFLRSHNFNESGIVGAKSFVATMNDTDFRKLFDFNYNELNVPPSSWSHFKPTDEIGQYYQSGFDGEWYVQVVVQSVFPINPDDDKETTYGKTLEVSFHQKPRDLDMTPPVCPYCESPKCGCVLRHSPTGEPPICPCPTDVLRQDKPIGKEEEM